MSGFASYLSDLQRFGIQPGLERIRSLLSRAALPHEQFPHLLVGGTNGKGSTAEFCARLLATGGRRVGLYTSPHLYQWNERLRILPGTGLFEGAISDAELDELWQEQRPHVEAVARDMGQPTEFEVVTFLALCHFARHKVDAAVLEVGLGGKWDATNATNPCVSVVTHVALDHCDRLGNTLEQIAHDKAHIARPERPFLTLETRDAPLRMLEETSKAIGANFHHITSEASSFQERNFALALAASHAFCEQVGWEKPQETPFFPLRVPGRLETIASAPRIVLDGANNPEGAQIISDALEVPRERLWLVLGVLKDKDWRAMTQILAPRAHRVFCTQSSVPRALPASELGEEALRWNPNVRVFDCATTALDEARRLARIDDTILVTGSFTLLGEVPREVPRDESPVPTPS